MIESIALPDLVILLFSAALVVTCGTLYVLLYFIAHVKDRPVLMPVAYASYAVLVVNAFVLMTVMHLGAVWQVSVLILLVAMLLAPHVIWNLCSGRHLAHDKLSLPEVLQDHPASS